MSNPFTIQTIDALNPALVEQVQAGLAQILQERHPELELGRGVFHDLVLHFSAVCNAVSRTELQRVLHSRSLLEIQTHPALADPLLVDHVLSNFGVTRRPGGAASGLVTFVVTGATAVVLSTATQYTANGVVHRLNAPYIAKAPGNQAFAANERVLTPRGDGTYMFTVTATAAVPGTAGNLRRGSRLVPDQVPARFVMAYAATDFTGGVDTESNQELLDRLRFGFAAQTLSGRDNMEAVFRSQPQFANNLHYSIIGFGNPEMHRDQHWIWPMSGGGRVDVYARTAALPRQTQLQCTATLIGRQGSAGLWQFQLPRDAAPGFYEVVQVLRLTDPPDISGFEIVSDVRGFDLSGDGVIPDIQTVEEAAYTAYQTAIIQFLDTETPSADIELGQTADYTVVVSAMPLVAELQQFCLDPKYRALAADLLVKAPIPCTLTINCDVEQAAGETAPDLSAMRLAIAAAVNNLNFPGQLHASTIADVMHGFLSQRQAVGPIEMRGRIRRPDGHILHINNNQVLTLPDAPSRATTGRTTALLLDPANIGLGVTTKGFGRSG